MERAAFGAAVQGALAALPEKSRRVVRLVDVAGLSYVEAAGLLGVPVGAVMSRLHRARVASGRTWRRPGWRRRGGPGEVVRRRA
jgi:DNA-directed RNA polymerase specialized sigma24 family protein